MIHFLNISPSPENSSMSAILQKSYRSLAAALLIRALVFAAKISIAATVLTFIGSPKASVIKTLSSDESTCVLSE